MSVCVCCVLVLVHSTSCSQHHNVGHLVCGWKAHTVNHSNQLGTHMYTVASGCAGVPGVVCVISSVLYYWQRYVCYVLRLIMSVCVR